MWSVRHQREVPVGEVIDDGEGAFRCSQHGYTAAPSVNAGFITEDSSSFRSDCRACVDVRGRATEFTRARDGDIDADRPEELEPATRDNYQQVLDHYGSDCRICGRSVVGLRWHLDHVNNDGKQHRELLRERGVNGHGQYLYAYLVRTGFETDGYELQVLCEDCHFAKSADEKRGKPRPGDRRKKPVTAEENLEKQRVLDEAEQDRQRRAQGTVDSDAISEKERFLDEAQRQLGPPPGRQPGHDQP